LAAGLQGSAGLVRLAQVCDRWIDSACLCFGLTGAEQERSQFRYTYSSFQLEYTVTCCSRAALNSIRSIKSPQECPPFRPPLPSAPTPNALYAPIPKTRRLKPPSSPPTCWSSLVDSRAGQQDREHQGRNGLEFGVRLTVSPVHPMNCADDAER
jgi:hypothetical protein